MRKVLLLVAILLILAFPAWCQNPFNVAVTSVGTTNITTNIAASLVTVQQISGTPVAYTVTDACLPGGHTTVVGAGAPYTFTGATCGAGYPTTTTTGTLKLNSGVSVNFRVTQTPKTAPSGATTCAGLSDSAPSCSVDATLVANVSGAVPNTRTVNGHALSSNVSVTAADVGAPPTSTTVNGHALSGNVSVTASDVGLGSVENAAASTLYVPLTRTVNGHALSSNVSVTAADVGAVPTGGNAGTATALASTPTKCSAGNFPLGIDVSGNAQNCAPAGGSLPYNVPQTQVSGAPGNGSAYTPTDADNGKLVIFPTQAAGYTVTFPQANTGALPTVTTNNTGANGLSVSAGSGTTASFTMTAGRFAYLYVAWNIANVTLTGASNSKGDICAVAGAASNPMGSSTTATFASAYCQNLTGGSTTFTFTFGGTGVGSLTQATVSVVQYTGVATSSPLDQVSATFSTSGIPTTPTVTTTSSVELVIGVLPTAGSCNTAGIGFNSRVTGANLQTGGVIEDVVVAATGNYSATSATTCPANNGMQILTFKTTGLTPTFGVGWHACYVNASSAAIDTHITLAATTSTITGLPSNILVLYQGACLYSDGVNYEAYTIGNASGMTFSAPAQGSSGSQPVATITQTASSYSGTPWWKWIANTGHLVNEVDQNFSYILGHDKNNNEYQSFGFAMNSVGSVGGQKMSTTSFQASNFATTDHWGFVGAGYSMDQNALIPHGFATVPSDGTTTITAGDYVVQGPNTGGQAKSGGTNFPFVGDLWGRAIETYSGGYGSVCIMCIPVRGGAYGVYSNDQLAQGSAVTDTTMWTVGGTTSTFRFSATLGCTTSSASATATLNLKWTDTSNTAQTLSVTATCTTLGAASIADMVHTIRAKNATTITYGVTIANTPTFDINVRLESLGGTI